MSIAIQAGAIFPYPLTDRTAKSIPPDKTSPGLVIGILIANGLMSNRNSATLLKRIDARDSTFVLDNGNQWLLGGST